MKYICSKCKHTEDITTRKTKCDCGGLWKLSYQVPKFDLDLVGKDIWNMFRYHRFMALPDESWRAVTLGEGMTPIISFDQNLMLKMEYYMPTLSFKDRGAAVLMAACQYLGVKSVVQDSSGNAGNSVAAYAARCGIACKIFVPEGTSNRKIAMIRSHGAAVNIVQGSRDHCAQVCRDKVEKEGGFYASHVFNPFFYEGTKTYIYEIYEQLHRIPTNIFVPLGNGTLFIGVVKALEELLDNGIINEMPNVVAVQSEYCSPFVNAVKIQSLRTIAGEIRPTRAEGIAVGEPMRGEEILGYIYKYGFKMMIAPEEEIVTAKAILASNGIYCEDTTAANYAAYLSYCRTYGPTPDSIIPMCGAGLKSGAHS